MKTYPIVKLVFLCAAISGCATGYNPSGLLGGYEESKIQEDVYKVSYEGNGYTSDMRVIDFSLLRCAELTLKAGYSYFEIISDNAERKSFAYSTPTTSQTTGSAQTYGNTTYYQANTTVQGGGVNYISYPTADMTIKMLKSKPKFGNVYEAKQVEYNLKQKYKIK